MQIFVFTERFPCGARNDVFPLRGEDLQERIIQNRSNILYTNNTHRRERKQTNNTPWWFLLLLLATTTNAKRERMRVCVRRSRGVGCRAVSSFFWEREREWYAGSMCAHVEFVLDESAAPTQKKKMDREPRRGRWCHWQQQEQMHPEPRRNRLPKHNQTTFLRLFHQHSLTMPCFGVAMVAMKHKSNEPKAFSFSFSKTTVGSKTPFWLQLIFGHTQTSVVVRGGSFFVWEALSCDGENQ